MRKFPALLIPTALLCGCQTVENTLTTSPALVTVTGPTASAIAGDMASRLVEHIGQAGATTIKMERDGSEFATALEAALEGWGYRVVTDGRVTKNIKPFKLAYSIDGADGQVLVRLSTPTIALGRAYRPTAAGAIPASPLSIMQHN
ncbi:conjugal transfer protein TrbH [Ensifer sp. ENS06]|uniref:conjugal transfer protein TrbH n=1 Tax=Ensifer sp. ENS06 TaxID=2769276 RepID=UPI00177EF3AE|nr:conjugal transfer protein TrbH [Ensifer sp. ENS06]MBD9627964.1 conjugal transfer protein TrbH [Ensifer sp. ENS06]